MLIFFLLLMSEYGTPDATEQDTVFGTYLLAVNPDGLERLRDQLSCCHVFVEHTVDGTFRPGHE